MLRCPEPHEENVLVMSTGEMRGRMVRSGILGCPVCHREYPIVKGVVHFSGGEGTPLRDKNMQSLPGVPSPPSSLPALAVDAQTLQALLDLSGPGGYVVLLGPAARGWRWGRGCSWASGVDQPSIAAAVGSASAYTRSMSGL